MEVHRCRFVEYQPAAINTLDFTPATVKETRLAVGRANGNIEIWDPTHNYRLVKTLPGGEDLSVESVVWAHQNVIANPDPEDDPEDLAKELEILLAQPPRLFSSGLNPYIMEWDTTTMTVKKSCDTNGGAVWCLAVNSKGTRLAAGCEDGCVRLFDIADGNLEYIRTFEPQKGRVLSVAWAPNDEFIVSGGSDSAIRTWNPHTGRTIQRMTVTKKRKEQTLVWAVAALQNNTIVSGDSLGTITFWDVTMGTAKQTFRAHGADVLCLAASKDGNQVFSAGVDRKITCFRRITKKKTGDIVNDWINVGSRRYHWHDIRALALDERPKINSIVSGGVDVELIACPAVEFPKLIQNRLPPFPHKYIVSMSKSHKLIMATFFNSISLWRLGKATNVDLSAKQPALPEMVEPHQLALELKLKPDCNITSSALSEDANWIAVADIENVRLFRVSQGSEPGQLEVKKQRSFDRELNNYLATQNAAPGGHHVLFTPGSDKLIIITPESRILIVDLTKWEEGAFEVLREFGHHRGLDSEGNSSDDQAIATVTSLCVSSDGQWLATGDDENRIHVFNLDNLKHHLQLPRGSIPHTTLSFNDFRPNELLVALATNAFYIYDVEHKRLTNWSNLHQDMSKSRLLEQRDRIRNVMYNPADKNKMILYGSGYMCLVDIEDKPVEKQLGKRKNSTSNEIKSQPNNQDLPVISISYQYQQILYAGFIGENQMVMIERPKFSVLENLPPSFYKAHFGAA
ncbi:quinon protein alcohol dehydrogenase-like superfamily [Cokeromyces recurvatus]|uniref:quinon protein alcohol dehydrogenase-like superfamily n=1 Tax=Cokeromyces recurvatus TaxID=90255 RepID=UPI00221FE4AF|nr:quinon protein alcohol dehydrogenase-like superfamily [Cokeromyces recurvatus]KAI7901402.1 quinon protein alcohol dehydrogenase-like superfamily [Cokeromyces recurvatus]